VTRIAGAPEVHDEEPSGRSSLGDLLRREVRVTRFGSRARRGCLLAVLLVSGRAANGDGVGLEIKSPDEGQLVGGNITVRGSVASEIEGARLRVNGVPASLNLGNFESVIEAKADGPFQVRVVYAAVGLPATTVERKVVVDRTPPVLAILAPAAEESDSPSDEAVIRGVVTEPNLLHVRMNGQAVQVPPGGRFEVSFLLPEKGATRVVIEALDRVGNRTEVVRVIRHAPGTTAPSPAPSGTPGAPAGPSAKPTPPVPPAAPPTEKPPAPKQATGPAAFAHRLNRQRGLELGETSRTQEAVREGLRWLAAHQSPDGRWEAAGFSQWCDGKPFPGDERWGQGKALYDVGVTALAVSAFLAAGHTGQGDGEFAPNVSRGLAYLLGVQDKEGRFGQHTMPTYNYVHAAASLALIEAYGMTGTEAYRASAQKALDYIHRARNPGLGWRYGVRPGDNDTSVTGWMMLALRSARLVNEDAARRGQRPPPLTVEAEAFDGVRAWLSKVTDPDTGRVGYVVRGDGSTRPVERAQQFPEELSEYTAAIGLLAHVVLGQDPAQSGAVKKGASLLMKVTPKDGRSGQVDLPYWYFGTQSLFQLGGIQWQRWNDALHDALLGSQLRHDTYCVFQGSWLIEDVWSPEGGSVYATAMACLLLSVPNLYERVPKPK
jgi:hypothetical protein